MCLPAAVAAGAGVQLTGAAATMANLQFAMSALAIGAQYVGQQKQADAQAKFQAERLVQTQAIAADAARTQYEGLLKRQSQPREAAAQDVQGALQRTLQATAASRVAAAAGGVSGGVATESAGAWATEYEDWVSKRQTSQRWEEDQIRMSMEGVRAQQINRINGAIGGPIAGPSLGAALGQLGSAAFNSAAFWSQA